jgi:hypothetical protein
VSDDDDKVIPIMGRPILEAGGPIDESGATLVVLGEELDPDEVTALLGVQPTHAFRQGDRPGPRSPPSRHGGWMLEVRGQAPDGPEVQLRKLLMQLPTSDAIWRELRERYRVNVSFGLHMEAWNRGFTLDPVDLGRIGRMGVPMGFDIYADLEDDEEM